MKNLEKRASLFAKILRSLSPKRSLVSRSRKLAFEPLENRELLTATPSLSLIDLRTNAALAHSDTIALTSFYADASGAATNPSYGEVVYRRVELTNIGDDPLAIDAIALSSGSRVEISGACATSLAPNDSAILTLKWRALAAESSTLTIQTDDPVQATYQLNLTGAVLANTYIAPQLSALTLQCDTGANANDLVTCNPTVTGAISGDLYGGRLDVEFDLDNDAQVDAITPIYVDNSVFAFDPSEISAAFVAPDSGTRAVSLRYRPAIYDAYGDLVERGVWQTLSYTLEPAPSGTITVSNLALAANYDGDWTQTNVAKLSGTISGANDRFVQISINNDVYTYPTSESSFCVPIPDAFSYGVATTIRARGGQFDSTTQRVLYGAWSTISVTPTLVGVASLALETDDGDYDDDNISSDLTLVGALDAGIGANFAEVEFSCGNVVLGSTYADENGEFSFKPTNLPINDGGASGTIVARAVYRPANGAPIYGASRSIAVVYATPYSAESYNLAVALDSPKENAPNSTSAPSIVLSGEFNADLDVDFEYRWKLSTSSTWSAPQYAYGRLDEELNVDEEAETLFYNATCSVPALYNISTSSANIDFQARPVLYDEQLQSYVSTSAWTTYAFTFHKPTADVPTIATFALAAPADALGVATSDPTVSGKIASDGRVSGVKINFYSGATLIGETTTDERGAFLYELPGLTNGAQTISCAAEVWDATTRQYVEGASQTLAFTYSAPTVAAPTFSELRIWDDTGAANDGVTANTTIYGRITATDSPDDAAYLLVEYDVDGDGDADGNARTNAEGEFFFAPTLAPGARAIAVRAGRWDSANQTEVVGSWSSLSVTVVAPTNAAPLIVEFASDDAALDPLGALISSSTTVSGRVSSETAYSDLRVEYEFSVAGVSGTTTKVVEPDALGRFCWTPALDFSTTDANVTTSARVGVYDATTQTTTYGAWSTIQFVYRATTESEIETLTAVASDRSGADPCELKFSGEVERGRGVRSYRIEYDVDGDGIADGRVEPNSSDRFIFYATPTTSNLRARVVDRLLDDSERVSSQGWVQVSTPNYLIPTSSTTLRLYFEDDVDYVPYLQVENFSGNYATLTISLDYDRDGEADATISPNASGKIAGTAIASALSNADAELRDGFSVVFASLATSGGESETIPFPNYSGQDASERARFEDFAQLFTELVDYDPTSAPGTQTTAPELVYQTTPEEDVDEEYAALTVDAQMDCDILSKTPIPTIARPNLAGEQIDLSKDVALIAQLDAIERVYYAAVRAAQDAWTTTYRSLVAAYDSAVDAAWNTYSKEYSRASKEYDEVAASSWTDTDEHAKIAKEYQEEISQLTTNRTERTTALTTKYNAQCLALKAAYDASVWSGHTSNCSGSNHTNACQIQQINAQETYYKAKIQLSLDTLAEQMTIDAEYNAGTLAAQSRRDVELAEGERDFEQAKEARLATLSSQMATAGRDYRIAAANALCAFYAGADPAAGEEREGGLADANATYRKAVATLAETATTDSWTAIRNAATAWKTNAGTGATWGGYVNSLYGIAETEALANASAYKTAVYSDADAQKEADVAVALAFRTYLTSEATASCVRDQTAAANVATLRVAAITATATATIAEANATSSALTTQIDAGLAIRSDALERMRADGFATGAALGTRDRTLVGITNYDQRWAIESATREQLSALWKSNALSRAASEISIYDSLASSASALESSTLAADYAKQTALWSALGAYWKSEIDRNATYEIALDGAKNTYLTSTNAAEKDLLDAQVDLESTYDRALTTAAATRATSEFTTTKNLWTSEYATYFNALSAACQNMPDAAVGGYYNSLVTAARTDYNAQWDNDAYYFNSSLTKERTYANTTRDLDADYASDSIDAVYDYYGAQVVSNAGNLSRTQASDRSEIDARVAYYVACEAADYGAALETLGAKRDALTRKIDLLSTWSQYVIDKNWTYDTIQFGGYDDLTFTMFRPSYSGSVTYAGFTGGARSNVPTATSVDSVTIEGLTTGEPSSIAGMSLATYSLSWQGYNASTLWTSFHNMNDALKALTISNASLASDTAKATARHTYATAYGAIYGAEALASLNASERALTNELSAESALNSALWTASETAHDGALDAIDAADNTSALGNYINASVGSSLDYAQASASAFGTFQIASRQARYNATPSSNPRKALYSQDATWATNSKSLRDQYYASASDSIADFYSTITDAYADYASSVRGALSTAEQAYFAAQKSYSLDAQDVEGDYALAIFDAEKSRALAYVDAAIAQICADYAAEASLASARSGAYALKKSAADSVYASTQFSQGRGEAILILHSGTSTEQNAYYDGIVSASSQIVTIRNEADSNDATFASQYDSALASARATNAAAYESATSAAEDAYKEALDDAWLDAYLERLSLGATLKDAYDQATATAKSALDDASDDLRAALFAGYDAFDAEMSEYLRAFSHYQTRIDLGQSVPNDAIENPTYDFEVCFVAGTPVRMADGSTKPIEALEVGDMVLAANHLNPESEPAPARVARTFDNGLKDVVELAFADGTSLVCTPSHRFYVCDRGWVCASEMRVGEFCLNAKGDRVEFVGREEIAERRGVYNIEVEEKHTYFAGEGVLVHNACPVCGGKGTIKKGFITKRDVPCPRCQRDTFFTFEEFARNYITGSKLKSDNLWGLYSDHEYFTYNKGCVGLALVSIHEHIVSPEIDKDKTCTYPNVKEDFKNMTINFNEAIDLYEQYRLEGKSPVLIMMRTSKISDEDINDKKAETRFRLAAEASYDYCTLINIDIGYGVQPMWLHAEAGTHTAANARVMLTPVEIYSDPLNRKRFFIVIPNSNPRSTIKYDLTFPIGFLKDFRHLYEMP